MPSKTPPKSRCNSKGHDPFRRARFLGKPMWRIVWDIFWSSEGVMGSKIAKIETFIPRTDQYLDHIDQIDHIDHTDHMDRTEHVYWYRIDHIDRLDYLQ